jgi:hypothetical protein
MTTEQQTVLSLYQQIVSSPLLQYLQKQAGMKVRKGIYCARVVLWLMILQRLQRGATLTSAVQLLVQGAAGGLLQDCHRVRLGRISARTGGYCQARGKLPKLLFRQVTEEIIEQLRQILGRDTPGQRNVFLLDGSSVELEHCRELLGHYPPATNQHGTSHWPVLRIVVAHDADTGLASCPCWGAMYGEAAISEQALAEQSMAHLPEGATVLGDRNFGVFWMAYAAQQRNLGVVLRREREPAWSSPVFPYLGWIFLGWILTWAAVELNMLQRLLDTESMTGGQWVVVMALSLVAPVIVGIDKEIQLSRQRKAAA